MHRWIWLLAVALLLPLGACGGGSTTGLASLPQASVMGVVMSRDGSTDDLGGVRVTCPESGDAAVTDAWGTFDLDVPRGRIFRLLFQDPTQAGDLDRDRIRDREDREREDPRADGTDIEGDEVEVDALDEGEDCEIEVDLENGEVIEARVRRRHHDGDDEHESEGRLERHEKAGEEDAEAEFEVESDDACSSFEIEVEGYSGPTELEVWLFNDVGEEALLGAITIAADGEGHLEVTFCLDDELPFGATSIRDLAGTKVEVYDEDANLVFHGRIPGFTCDDDHHDADKDDGEKHEGDIDREDKDS